MLDSVETTRWGFGFLGRRGSPGNLKNVGAAPVPSVAATEAGEMEVGGRIETGGGIQVELYLVSNVTGNASAFSPSLLSSLSPFPRSSPSSRSPTLFIPGPQETAFSLNSQFAFGNAAAAADADAVAESATARRSLARALALLSCSQRKIAQERETPR